MREALAFDDVLLSPQYSDISSRGEVDISSSLGTIKSSSVEPDDGHFVVSISEKEEKLSLPIISSPMDTVTEDVMANAMACKGGLGIIHRYNTIERQAELVKLVKLYDKTALISAAIGATGDYLERASALVSAGAKIICIDVAHGHHSHVKEACQKIKEEFKLVYLIAGNVATIEGFCDLESWGADAIRVGIGGGSICSTRIRTGHGIPTFQSVLDCAKVAKKAKIIADGGIKTSGDIVKALAAGADFVMLGSMLSGATETPGSIIVEGDKEYKSYRGMASKEAQIDWRGSYSVSEGISTKVEYKGNVFGILDDIKGGIKSGLSYSGAKNLMEFQAYARFIRQTSQGMRESNTHILHG